MFVYEDDKKATLNVAFNTQTPVEAPEVVIEGYKNGAKVIVNGATAIDVENAEKFETIRRPFVYQKNDVLNVTFQDNMPVEAPEVTIDAIAEDKVSITANSKNIRVTYTAEGVTYEAPANSAGRKSRKQQTVVEEPAPVVEAPVEETPEVVEV